MRSGVRTTAWLLSAAVSLAALPARAQDYPSRAVELIVPFAPGGGAELMARLLADGLNKRLAFDPIADLDPVIMIANSPTVLAVPSHRR